MTPRLEPATMIVVVTIASLAIDRASSAVLLLLSHFELLSGTSSDEKPGARAAAERRLRLWSWLVAGVLATIVVVAFDAVRIMAALGVEANRLFDAVFTVLALTGGADFVNSLLKLRGATELAHPEAKPLEVTGTLVLEGSASELRPEATEKRAFKQPA